MGSERLGQLRQLFDIWRHSVAAGAQAVGNGGWGHLAPLRAKGDNAVVPEVDPATECPLWRLSSLDRGD